MRRVGSRSPAGSRACARAQEDRQRADPAARRSRAGVGRACTEAPRGILYHRYRLDADGTILDARLVPPSAQNQGVIEEDLREVAAVGLDLEEDELKARGEHGIRNHDPCISCAAHFLKLRVHPI
ncbi:MAG: nickel-dependent hydrogenase large subunit [Stellaceae bacterium]